MSTNQKPQLTVITSGSKPTKSSLVLGDRSPAVRDLKIALLAAGYTTLNGSDEFDATTHKSVMLLQESFGKKGTGVFDKATCGLLEQAIEKKSKDDAATGAYQTKIGTKQDMSAQADLNPLTKSNGAFAGEIRSEPEPDEKKMIATLEPAADPAVPWPVVLGAGMILFLFGAAFFKDRSLKAAPIMLDN